MAAEVVLVARDARDDRLIAQASRTMIGLTCVAVDGEALVVQVQVVVDLPWQQLLLGREGGDLLLRVLWMQERRTVIIGK